MQIEGDLKFIVDLAHMWRRMANTPGWKKLEEAAASRITAEEQNMQAPAFSQEQQNMQLYQKGTINGMLLLLGMVKTTISEGERIVRDANDGAWPSDDGET